MTVEFEPNPGVPRRRRLLRGLALSPWLLSCGPVHTEGTRITLRTRITSDVEQGTPFQNAFGWSIRLDRARLGVEHLYYVTGEPVGASSWLERVFVSRAHAHPGHYDAGDVLGEMPTPTSIDLLAGSTDLGEAPGVTGHAGSAVVTLGRLNGSGEADAGGPDSAVALALAGVATRQEQDVTFRVDLPLQDLLHPDSDLPEVSGCPFEETLVADGIVTCLVQTRVWLDQVDFALLGETGMIEPGTEPHNALTRGVKKAVAYAFAFQRSSP